MQAIPIYVRSHGLRGRSSRGGLLQLHLLRTEGLPLHVSPAFLSPKSAEQRSQHISFPSYERFSLTSGNRDELTLYEFHKKVFKHYFCPTCGVQMFMDEPGEKPGEVRLGVNVRTVDGVDLQKLKIRVFDGKTLL